MLPGTHVTTTSGREYSLTCRAKCGPFRGWFAMPCRDGKPDTNREKWIGDDEIVGVLDKRGQYFLEMEA
jgi:hypothetical protein